MKEEEINAIEETLNGMTFIKDVDDVVDYLETLGEVHFCDEGIDDGIDDEDCEDEVVGMVAVNDPPVAKSQTYMTQEGEVLKVPASEGLFAGVLDPDGEKPVSAQLVQRPRNGKIDLNERDGSFTYTPNRGFSGLDEFTFKVKDPGGVYSKVETAEVNVTFKMKDLRGNAPKPAPKVEEPAKDEKPAKEDKKGKKKKKKR